MARFKRLFQEWRKSFDVVLGEAGSPCQDFTILSAKRRGLERSRSSLFFRVPAVLEAAAAALDGQGVPMGVFEENVVMEDVPRDKITQTLGVLPHLGTARLLGLTETHLRPLRQRSAPQRTSNVAPIRCARCLYRRHPTNQL